MRERVSPQWDDPKPSLSLAEMTNTNFKTVAAMLLSAALVLPLATCKPGPPASLTIADPAALDRIIDSYVAEPEAGSPARWSARNEFLSAIATAIDAGSKS